MRTWFRRRDRKSAAETPEEAPESSVQKSLALNTLFHQIREGQKYTILDLGPPVGANVEFFSISFRRRTGSPTIKSSPTFSLTRGAAASISFWLGTF
jgi:hypothetical protein